MRTLCLLLLCSIVLFQASGQAGSLDQTFGNKGIQTTAFLDTANTLSEIGKAVLTNTNGDILLVVQVNGFTKIVKYLPDGKPDSSYGNAGYSNTANLVATSAAFQGDKIIVAGYIYGPDNGKDFALARYTADGVLDDSFGENGEVITDFNSYTYSVDIATSIALQGDKIIVAGNTFLSNSGGDFALARYTTNGTLDSSFGVNGLVITDFNGGDDRANAIALQGDKIVVAGGNSDGMALVRYMADGKLDASFGVNGLATGTIGEARAIALQGGKIIAAGFRDGFYNGDFADFALARYTADGSLDSSFGVNGSVLTDFNNTNDELKSIALQGDKIIAAGRAEDVSNQNGIDFALARYTADGSLDSSFGVNGKVTTDFNNYYDGANAIALQGDKIIVAGNTLLSIFSSWDFALTRYNTNGTLDASFGVNGKLTGYFPTSHITFTSTALQGDKIIAAGYTGNYSYTPTNNDFALARYRTDGSLDSSFGMNGSVLTDFNNTNDELKSIALQGDKIIAAGRAEDVSNQIGDFALARYTADGKLDTSFGKNGKVTTNFNHSYDGANAIALQGTKIIVAGSSNGDFALARYTANGTLDASFGVNGKVTTDINSGSYDQANAIAIQGDKIIAAGHTYDEIDENDDIELARYTIDGKLDSSFGVNGLVQTGAFGSPDIATSVALQGDKIIVAGYNGNYPRDIVLFRYTANGRLDSTFADGGKVTTDFNNFSDDIANAIAIQENKIIVAGNTGNFVNGDFALVRYTADGALDPSFGVNGKVITHLDGSASIQDVAVQENRLYAVGSLSTYESYGIVAAYQLESSVPSISISDVTVSESQKQAVLTVQLSAPSTQAVQVHYITHYKTAYPPQDYTGTSGTLQFAAGTTTATIKIAIVDDSVCEHTEQFEVHLRNACNATIKDSIGVVTITDDDNKTVTLKEDNALAAKQQSTSFSIIASPNPSINAFTIQLQGTDLKEPVSIRVYDISGRLLEQREHISMGQILRLGDQYKAGTYIIEAVQGDRSVQTKVIKTGK